MKLEHIAGNTYYINFPSVIGVYIFNNNTCLLIDSGPSEAFGKKALKILEKEGLQVHAIFNTHAHADHSGGNQYIQKVSQCQVYAAPFEAAFLENPILGPYCLYTASPINALKNKFIMPQPSKVNFKVLPGSLSINNMSFTLIDLAGHTMEHLGLITPDNVFFTGDSLITLPHIKDFPFLYLADIEKHINTLNYFRKVENKTWVLSHGGLQDNITEIITENYRLMTSILDFITDNLKKPMSREEIVSKLIVEMNLPDNRNQYILISGSISAYLSYLCNTKQVRTFTEAGCLKFQSV